LRAGPRNEGLLAAPASRSSSTSVSSSPGAFLERLCRLLETYWEATFASEWERLEPQLSDSVVDAGRLLAAGDLDAFIATLEPRVHLLHEERHLVVELACTPQWGADPSLADIDVEVPGTFTLVPSAFSWPHARASTEPPWPLGMTYPAPFVRRQAQPRTRPTTLSGCCAPAAMMYACGFCAGIAESPRSTQELAPLIGITQSALSKHLRQLADAGVLEPRRDGKYLLYHLRPDRLETLSESLIAYLGT
jgi:DNA-binding transcriptional ArsR family regulator